MTIADPFASGAQQPGVVAIRVSTPRLLAATLRDPLSGVPPACREARMVVAENFGRRRAYITDPVLIHEALVRNADRLHKSAEMKRVLGVAVGDGLLTADGGTWRHQRQTMAPAFQHEKLQALVPQMIAAAEATRARWLAVGEGAIVDLGHEMMRTTFAIILDTMLSGPEGIDAARVEHGLADYLAATSWMFALALLDAPAWVPHPGKRKALRATAFMRETVQGRVRARRAEGPRGGDLLDLLLAASDPETGAAMTNAEVTDNILTFIGAGHETTAIALGWAFALLEAHPACRDRVLAEIETVTGGGPLRPEHVGKLVYARQVVSEALRLYPPAPLITRKVAAAIEVGSVALPAGSVILIPIHAVHRHPATWPRPDAFDPDRFAPEAVRARHRFAFMPFGAGPRTCIGSLFAMLEAVAILAVLLKAVRLEPVEPTLPKARMRVTLRPERALRMRVSRR